MKVGYNPIAKEYTAFRSEDTEDIHLLEELVDRLPRGAKVLDAGCGSGVPMTRHLAQFFEVIGVDFAEEQIRRARRLVPEATFLCEDITELAFDDGTFDTICSYYAIIHIPRDEHRGLLRNFYRMLRPGGLVLLAMGSTDTPEDSADYHGARMFWSHYDAETNQKMLKDVGFAVIWAKLVADPVDLEGGEGLFVLARKRQVLVALAP
ncbi:MAG: methyltransferase domain-containing protein [Thermoplasmata archaeon]